MVTVALVLGFVVLMRRREGRAAVRRYPVERHQRRPQHDGVADLVDASAPTVVQHQVALDLYVPLATLRHIFITHQHSDHNADYGNLMWLAWTAGLRTRVDTWGPPPLDKMTKLFFEMNEYDINARISNEGRIPLVPLVHAHELRGDGAVMSDDNVKVSAALVEHPPTVPAFAYRFDTPDRSIVISGDTNYSENVVTLARDPYHKAPSLRLRPPDPGHSPNRAFFAWRSATRPEHARPGRSTLV